MLRCDEILPKSFCESVPRVKTPAAQQRLFACALPHAPRTLPDWVSRATPHESWRIAHAAFAHSVAAIPGLLAADALQCDVTLGDGACERRALTPLHFVNGEQATAAVGCRVQSAALASTRRRRYLQCQVVIECSGALRSAALSAAAALAPMRGGADACALESAVLRPGRATAVPLGGVRWPVALLSLRRCGAAAHAFDAYIEATYVATAVIERLAHASLRHAVRTGAAPTLDWADGGVDCRDSSALGNAVLAHWYASVARAHPLAAHADAAQLEREFADITGRVRAALAANAWLPASPPRATTPVHVRQRPAASTPERVERTAAPSPSPPPKKRALHPAFVDADEQEDDYCMFNLLRSYEPNASQYATV